MTLDVDGPRQTSWDMRDDDQLARLIERSLGDRPAPLLIALDGRSGAGKTTLACSLRASVAAAVVTADDFYAGGSNDGWLRRRPRERVEGVLDWVRLRDVALKPLLARQPASWHPLDFQRGVGWVGWKSQVVTVEPADIVLVDGAYSSRPELGDLIDLTVLVEAPESTRRERIRKREGDQTAERWHRVWDAAEDLYFNDIRPRTFFDQIVQGT